MDRKFIEGKVSVIIPIYNAEKYLRKTLDSILVQTYKDIEIVLVDDCSNDDSANIIKEYIQKYPEIVYFLQETNQGAGAARNKALELATGQYVAFLDSDDIWYPNKVAKQLELMKKRNCPFSYTAIEMIDEKLDLYYKFSNKYGQTEQKMLDYLEKAKEKRNSILFADEELNRLNEEYENLLNITVKLADKLSAERKKTAKIFEEKVKQELAFLDMPKMQFYVDFNKGNLSSTGYDKIEFLISANPGEPPKSLSKVASGGELSRIMLAIKNIISYNDTIGTLIFDEIDTGVSGRASQKIGLKLKSVSKNTQVICVTHSAQIASNADEHFLIQKEFNDNKTFTCVTPLDFEGRKQELARIMGGLEITDTLLQSAEELLNQNLCSD